MPSKDPEMMMCQKKEECDNASCRHYAVHPKLVNCHLDCMSLSGHCVPFKPKAEGKKMKIKSFTS